MLRGVVLAFILGTPCAVRAGDPAGLAAVDAALVRGDEKAFLAAALIEPGASAELEADWALAGQDAALKAAVVEKWRGKAAAFAKKDMTHPTPDLYGTYRSYEDMMTPQMRAYLKRRLPTMKEDDRDELIDYLDSVDSSLSDDQKLSWYTRKVVEGIFEHYRTTDLGEYVNARVGQVALANMGAAEKTLAGAREKTAATPPAPPVVPSPTSRPSQAPKPPATVASGPKVPSPTDPSGPRGPLPGPSSGGALDQLKGAAGDGAADAGRLGRSFDGSGGATPDGVPATGGGSGSASLQLPSGGGTPSLVAEVPSPEGGDFASEIRKHRSGKKRFPKREVMIASGGAVAGVAIAALLIGTGPVGWAIGGLLGWMAANRARKKLLR